MRQLPFPDARSAVLPRPDSYGTKHDMVWWKRIDSSARLAPLLIGLRTMIACHGYVPYLDAAGLLHSSHTRAGSRNSARLR